MNIRDDFTQRTKDELAKRVAMRCSNPSCKKPTSGPRSQASKSINIGVAAHITAAAPDGPRYDEAISSEQRSGIENGIWLCQNCAKLIDNDPERYTVDCLTEWRQAAESTAISQLESGKCDHSTVVSMTTIVQIKMDIEFSNFDEREKRIYKHALASFLGIPVDSVSIESVEMGSVIIYVRLPKDSAQHLENEFLKQASNFPMLQNTSLVRCLGNATAISGRVFALLVAINNYPIRPLSGSLHESFRLRQLLQDSFSAKDIFSLYDHHATKENIFDALHSLATRARLGDTLIFSFGGHSEISLNNEDLILHPVDSQLDRSELSGISLQEVLQLLAQSLARKMILLDVYLPSGSRGVIEHARASKNEIVFFAESENKDNWDAEFVSAQLANTLERIAANKSDFDIENIVKDIQNQGEDRTGATKSISCLGAVF